MVYNDLIFIHIPKTGGSSIRSSLANNYKLLYNATEQNFIKLGYSNLTNFENYNFSIHNFKDHLPYQIIKKNKLEKNKCPCSSDGEHDQKIQFHPEPNRRQYYGWQD